MVDVLRNEIEQTEKRPDEKPSFVFNYSRMVDAGVSVVDITSPGLGVFQASKGLVPLSTPLVISGATFQLRGQKVAAFFDAGTDGEDYDVWSIAILSDGQRLTVPGLIRVRVRT